MSAPVFLPRQKPTFLKFQLDLESHGLSFTLSASPQLTLTVHREETSSLGFTISTEGSVQTDFFIQLILKPNNKEKEEIVRLNPRN